MTRKTEWHVGLGRVFLLWCTILLTKNVWHHGVAQRRNLRGSEATFLPGTCGWGGELSGDVR